MAGPLPNLSLLQGLAIDDDQSSIAAYSSATAPRFFIGILQNHVDSDAERKVQPYEQQARRRSCNLICCLRSRFTPHQIGVDMIGGNLLGTSTEDLPNHKGIKWEVAPESANRAPRISGYSTLVSISTSSLS